MQQHECQFQRQFHKVLSIMFSHVPKTSRACQRKCDPTGKEASPSRPPPPPKGGLTTAQLPLEQASDDTRSLADGERGQLTLPCLPDDSRVAQARLANSREVERRCPYEPCVSNPQVNLQRLLPPGKRRRARSGPSEHLPVETTGRVNRSAMSPPLPSASSATLSCRPLV